MFTVVWIPLVLLYPFYFRQQYAAAVQDKLKTFCGACVEVASRPYDEAVRTYNEALRKSDEARQGRNSYQFMKAVNAVVEADHLEDAARRSKELGLKECESARNRLDTEAFPPGTNAYQWFVRQNNARIWLLFDPKTSNQQYILEYLKADLKHLPIRAYLPKRIGLLGALTLAPVALYFLLIGGVALISWIIRGFLPSAIV